MVKTLAIITTKKVGSKSSRRRRARKAAIDRARSNSQLQATNSLQPSRKLNKTNQSSGSRNQNSRGRGTNMYLKTLQDPEGTPGVKVPDLAGFPSGTFQLSYDSTLTTGSGGDSVMIVVNPIIGDGSANYPILSYNGTSTGSLSAGTFHSWASQATCRTLFDSFRPVSGCVTAEFIGPTSSDGGILVGGLLPNPTGVGTVVPTTWAQAIAQPNNLSVPLRNGMRVTWRPQDNSDNEYIGPSGGNYAFMMIAATGLPSATTYIKVRVCMNYEALAASDTSNFIDNTVGSASMQQLSSAIAWAATSLPATALFAAYAGPYLMPGARRNRLTM